ncbi:oxidase [Lithospermum erythrorhizon]|uniref:laccase n=1 Tax=Lithospermum erythrorhizon TaxID=34254 RepID=A0AAV3PYM8_LITER
MVMVEWGTRMLGAEGTLFWHAHTGWHRATVHGAFVIRPKRGNSYPFQNPDNEFPIVIGEWFNTSIVSLENQLLFYGNGPNYSQGLTINGWLGDLYPCSSSRRRFLPEDHQSTLELPTDGDGPVLDQIFKVKVKRGKTYMLRVVCATLNNHAFFKVAQHTMTVVAIDAVYTTPYVTDIIVLAPGQTVDILITTDQKPASYYMASRYYYPLIRVDGVPANNSRDDTPQTALIVYEEASISNNPSAPIFPTLPELSDVPTAFKFLSSLKGLQNGPHWTPVPHQVDEHMFITAGLGVTNCTHEDKYLCQGPNFTFMAASLNNASFQLPTNTSLLEAYYNNVSGIYTTNFPNNPPKKFDFTNNTLALEPTLLWAEKGTKVKKLKYNSTVEIVFQNTAFVTPESHPIHLHGFNFYVLAQGEGNFNRLNDPKMFNLVNPQMRNTIAIPIGGWAAIRFIANNPGVWYMHCHLELHVPLGLATAFIVEDGPTPETTLPPPPTDFPRC